MSEHVDDAMRQADEAIAATKATQPNGAAEARVRVAKLMRLNKIALDAGKAVVAESARKAINGKAPAQKAATGAGLTDEELGALAEGIVGWLKPLLTDIETRLAAIEKHKGLAPLAARLGVLEQDAVKYGGIWNEDEVYQPGTLVTFQGGLWHCDDTNRGVRPGSGSSTWMLANKSRR